MSRWSLVPLRALIVIAMAAALAFVPVAGNAQRLDTTMERVESCMYRLVFNPATYGYDFNDYVSAVATCAGVPFEVAFTIVGDSVCYLDLGPVSDYFC